jgi:uncharacterized protein (DUF885 family)
MVRLIRVACIAILVLYSYVSTAEAMSPAQVRAEDGFSSMEYQYVVYVLQHYPVVATYLGGADYDLQLTEVDGKLRDYSSAGLASEQAQLAKFHERFTGLVSDEFSTQRRIDRSVALAQIEFMLHEQIAQRRQERSLDSYLDEPIQGIQWQIHAMTSIGGGTRGTLTQWQAVLARTRAIPSYLRVAEEQLAAGARANNTADWRLFVDGLESLQADTVFFSRNLVQVASQQSESVQSDGLLSDLARAGDEAAAAYQHMRAFLIENFFEDPSRHDANALKPGYRADRFALGDAEYNWALQHNLRVDRRAEELFANSVLRIEKTQDAMISLSRQIDSRDVDGAVSADLVVTRKALDKLFLDELGGYPKKDCGTRVNEWIKYAHDSRLFDISPDYRFEPRRGTGDQSIDEADYYSAQPNNARRLGRFNLAANADAALMIVKQDGVPTMCDRAAQKGFPGRDFQLKSAAGYQDKISPIRWITAGAVRDSSSMWQASMAIEGWAAYAQDVMSEPHQEDAHGAYSPEERLVQLRDVLIRELGVRVDTGIHTGRLSFDEAVDAYSETADFIPGACRTDSPRKDSAKARSCETARKEVARYARLPTQGVTAEVGEEQILALRQRAQRELGKDFSRQWFHLELMSQGNIPTAYFADALIKSMKWEN